MLAIQWEPLLLGIAAIITAFTGTLTLITSYRRTNRETKEKSEAECVERLAATRAESERLAEELHQMKMAGFE